MPITAEWPTPTHCLIRHDLAPRFYPASLPPLYNQTPVLPTFLLQSESPTPPLHLIKSDTSSAPYLVQSQLPSLPTHPLQSQPPPLLICPVTIAPRPIPSSFNLTQSPILSNHSCQSSPQLLSRHCVPPMHPVQSQILMSLIVLSNQTIVLLSHRIPSDLLPCSSKSQPPALPPGPL